MGVSVRQKAHDSAWWVFIRHQGERASKRIGDEQTAREVASAVKADIARGIFDISGVRRQAKPAEEDSPAVPTLREFYEKTMTPLWEASVAAKTFERYHSSFTIHILPVLGEVRVDAITRDRVKNLVVSLLSKPAAKRASTEEGRKREPERCLSRDSIRNIVAALRGALSEVVEKNLLHANPAVKLGKYYREAEAVREEPDPFLPDEVPLVLNATLQHFGFDHYVLLLAAFHTGLRASELAGLRWSDCDFRNRFVAVRRQRRAGATRNRTKANKRRKVDLSNELIRELQKMKKLRQETCLAEGRNEIPDWVFVDETGTPPDMNNFRNRVLHKSCDKAKIRRHQLHDTRHTFASILLMNGESPVYVKEQLGHSSIKITVDTYCHWIPGTNREAMNRLPSLSTPQRSEAANE